MRDLGKRMGLAATLLITLTITAGAAFAADPEVVEAVKNQDRERMLNLVWAKVNLNARGEDGSTALLWAAHWNDLETAALFIRAGADPEIANDLKMTPLSEACTNASAEMIALLINGGANPNTAVASGETPLMTCSRSGNLEGVLMMLAHDANVNAKEPTMNQTALMWAAAERHPEVVKALLEAKADFKAATKQGFTALHFAAREGDAESAKLLIAAGADINSRTQPAAIRARGAGVTAVNRGAGRKSATTDGYTPLLVATVKGQVQMALSLLERGADPNVLDAGFAPLHWAAGEWENGAANPIYGYEDPMAGITDRAGKLQLIKSLLAHGANPNLRMTRPQPTFAGGYADAPGATALLLAAGAADLEVMKMLVAAGADPKIPTETNANSIMAAAALNRLVGDSPVTEEQARAAVKFLVEAGVDPKETTTFGENALYGPAYRGWNTLLEELVKMGVNVNAVSKAGVTPWLAASGQGDRLGGVLYNKAGADMLLKYGADPKLGHPCQAQNKCRAE